MPVLWGNLVALRYPNNVRMNENFPKPTQVEGGNGSIHGPERLGFMVPPAGGWLSFSVALGELQPILSHHLLQQCT